MQVLRMNCLDTVTKELSSLDFMSHEQARVLRDFITEHDVAEVLEIGFLHGKSSAYIAAILEDLGRGHLLTVDRKQALQREPNIESVLRKVDLSHRVTPVFAERSFTWELAKMITADPRPQFDLCYFDADHTWEGTGFGFVLVDMLLRPGGWIVFDDLEWSMQASMKQHGTAPKTWMARSEDERAAAPVKMVFETLVPRLGYTDLHTLYGGWWGAARKPSLASPVPAKGKLNRILNAFSKS
jgi:predicted O-methyltransferase YrrM